MAIRDGTGYAGGGCRHDRDGDRFQNGYACIRRGYGSCRMRAARITAAALLMLIFAVCLFPSLATRDSSDEQFRNDIDQRPSVRYPLGTDELGRNRLSRLLTGTRTSLLLAPAAAFISVALASAAALLGISTGRTGNRVFEISADLMGSLPWLFLLIALRASLPLDAPATWSVVITFAVLAVLGW